MRNLLKTLEQDSQPAVAQKPNDMDDKEFMFIKELAHLALF